MANDVTQSTSRLEIMRDERIAKLEKLRDMGINPYPASAQKDHPNQFVIDNFNEFDGKNVSLSGRLMSWRDHGKLIFGNLEDQSGSIQLYIREDTISQTSIDKQILGFDDLKLVDVGDFVQATGTVTKTQSGEISLSVQELKILTKSLRPLPSRSDTVSNPEQMFRRRYLDLALNADRRAMFERKANFWRVNREFLLNEGFLEVETPVLEHVTGGADARPFTTHMNALNQEFFLRISSELYQKRLIGGGFEKIFTLGPNFRNEGLSDEHLTEYYQIEWYWAYANYENNMELVERMFKHIAKEVYGKTQFTTRGHTFDLNNSWERISYHDAIQEKLGIDIFNDSDEKMLSVVKDRGVKLSGAVNRSRLIDNLWKIIRKEISGPAFLINEPAFMSPLSKSKPDNPTLTERFHIIIAGSELGNGYSELNDPIDQFDRFKEQQAARDGGDDEAQMLDIDYVEMLEYGMPPTSGYGHSERVFWFLENVTAREGTLFPALRHKLEPLTKQIYGLKDTSATQENIYFAFSDEFSAQYPSASVGYALIEGVTIEKINEELEKEKAEVLSNITNLTVEEIGELPEIKSYRDMYKQMKVKFQSRRPSPEALLRRVAQGKGLYTVNTLVDAYNLVVMKHRVSVGAFDMSSVQFPTSLSIAEGGEKIHLLGDEEETVIKKGEVVYADQQGPYNLDYNYRDAQRTSVKSDTKNIWINVDGIGEITPEQVELVLEETIAMITKYCGGVVKEKGVVTTQ